MTAEMSHEISDIVTEIRALSKHMLSESAQFDSFETVARNLATVLAGQTKILAWVEQRLTKLDELEGIKESIDALNAQLIASRQERELSLSRIELRSKQS